MKNDKSGKQFKKKDTIGFQIVQDEKIKNILTKHRQNWEKKFKKEYSSKPLLETTEFTKLNTHFEQTEWEW